MVQASMTNIPHKTKKVNKESHPGLSSAKAGGGSGGPLPPCLFSNNSTEIEKNLAESPSDKASASNYNRLSSYHKKQAQTLYSNVDRLVRIESKSINHVAFLTLTFQENITDHKEAYRRFRSFNSHFLAPHPIYGNWVNVKEHQARGAWHFHMIIQLSEDIRTGFDFDKFDAWLKGPRKKGTFPTGNSQIRSLWAEFDKVLPEYGFGKIFTLEPIKSNAEAVSRYVGKYVSKQIGQRPESDKGVRLINYSRGWLKNSVNLAWYNDNSKLWRRKVALFARIHGCQELYQLAEVLGSDWAYRYQNEIMDLDIVPKKFEDEVYGVEKTYQNKLIPEMREKSSGRISADWNKHAIKNFEFADEKRQKALGQKVATRISDEDRNKKKQKGHVKVQNLINKGCEKWHNPQRTDYYKKESAREVENLPFTVARIQKQKLARQVAGGRYEYDFLQEDEQANAEQTKKYLSDKLPF